MKLRTRLLLFCTAILVALGFMFMLVYWQLDRNVLPELYRDLKQKAATAAEMLPSQIDVGLGAGDPAMIEQEARDVLGDPDFRFIEVRDPDGVVLYARGHRPAQVLAGDQPAIVVEQGEIQALAPIRLEGLELGTVTLVFSTDDAERLEHRVHRLALAVLVVWLAALAFSISFSRTFVRPIRAMMEFSRRVAGGHFAERLPACRGPGELCALRDHLNAMTGELAAREEAQRQAAARAAEMQRELLSVSRMAGMAEVATGVLHNVGNVLNSLNISVGVVSERLRGSKLPSLTRSVKLYQDHEGGLAGFLATDRGALFPQYLATLSRHLEQENKQLRDEIQSVNRNVEHIKTIVATQQAFARAGALIEDVDLSALLDDALRLGASSFEKHGIEVVRDYQDLPACAVDRHKLLQILINLVSNARHALKEIPAGRRRLTVHLRGDGDGVAIEVEDTGVGIAPDNLARIFQHGFTTKKGGHGFGLHSSANAAREMGGRLLVDSDGPGRGARFTLELPTRPKDRIDGA